MAEIVNHRRQPRNMRGYQALLKARLALLADFPKGVEISYRGDDDSLGPVIRHDTDVGRIVTRHGSYDPNEIKILIAAKP